MKYFQKMYLYNIFKWVCIPIILILFWIIASTLFNPYTPFTVIAYKSYSFTKYHSGSFLKTQNIKGEFKGEENNLGIIVVKIRGGLSDKPNDQESVQFTLKDNNLRLIYSNTYAVGAIREKEYLIFGFPKIASSKGKKYFFEITSLNGNVKNSLDLHPGEDFFVSKYITLRKSLKNPKEFILQSEGRLRMLFANIDALLVSSIYFLPFLFYFTLISFSKTLRSKLGSFTLSLIFLSIIFLDDIYTGIVLGLLGMWIISVMRDKVSYKYSLFASLFFFVLAGVFSYFIITPRVDSSSLWGYLLLVIGFIQITFFEIKRNNVKLKSKHETSD